MPIKKSNVLYDISVNGLNKKAHFTENAKKVINEINSVVGWGNLTRVSLEPSTTKKNCFSLSIFTETEGENIVITKTGRNAYSLLKSTKKATKKKAREIQFRKVKSRRKPVRSKWADALIWEVC